MKNNFNFMYSIPITLKNCIIIGYADFLLIMLNILISTLK